MCYIISLMAEILKNMPAVQEICFQSLSQEDPLEKGMATHSCILAWRVPWKRGSWRATVHGFTKESDATEVTKHTQMRLFIPLLNFLNYFIFSFLDALISFLTVSILKFWNLYSGEFIFHSLTRSFSGPICTATLKKIIAFWW